MDKRISKPTKRFAVYRNFGGTLWHSAFLSVGMALTQPTTVIAGFITLLTGSTLWIGGFVTVLMLANALPQLWVARKVERSPTKKPVLLLAIYLRVISWAVLSIMVYTLGTDQPQLLLWALVGLLAIFYAAGGLGGVPYTDIIGKIIPDNRRGAFFAGRELLGAPLAVGAALLARYILGTLGYPANYGMLFGLAAGALFVASWGFWIIREPRGPDTRKQIPSWQAYKAQLRKTGTRLQPLVMVQLLTGFSLMALPFYIAYGLKILEAPADAVGWFTLSQVLGGVLANFGWALLVDRYGSSRMLSVCAFLSSITPLVALVFSGFGWWGLLPALFLSGASSTGRIVGFSSALLELAPPTERPTFTALNATLIIPVAFYPLLAGIFLQFYTYPVLFVITAVFTGMGALMTRRLPA